MLPHGKRRFPLSLGLAIASCTLVANACSSDDDDSDTGRGGSPPAGGKNAGGKASGGSKASGGTSAGGTTAKGGTTGTTGGRAPSGGHAGEISGGAGATGGAFPEGGAIGTTGRGIGPCYQDKVGRRFGVRVGELLRPDHLRERLRYVVPYKNRLMTAFANGHADTVKKFDADQLTDEYLRYAERIKPFVTDTAQLLHDGLRAGRPRSAERAGGHWGSRDEGPGNTEGPPLARQRAVLRHVAQVRR